MSMPVCVSVCGRVSQKPRGSAELHQILCMLPVAVARSSFDGDAICCVLPVLWMTYAIPTYVIPIPTQLDLCGMMRTNKRRELLLHQFQPNFALKISNYASVCATGAKSAIYDCLVMYKVH